MIVADTFSDLRDIVQHRWPDLRLALLVREDAGRHGTKHCSRAFAYCAPFQPVRRPGARPRSRTDGYAIVVAPKIVHAPPERVYALLCHEMAHAVLLHLGHDEHTERDADAAAESIFGIRIYYDREDVQTTQARGNRRPRPAYLDDEDGFTRTS